MKRGLQFALTKKAAAEALSSPSLFKRALKAGWIKPVVSGAPGRSALFDVDDVRQVWDRIKNGERPNTKGLTLVELLGALCIISVITAIAAVMYGNSFGAGSLAAARHNAKTLNDAIAQYDTSGGLMSAEVPQQTYKSAGDENLAEVVIACRLASSDKLSTLLGGPFIAPYQRAVISRYPDDYRVIWLNGTKDTAAPEISYSSSGVRSPALEKAIRDGIIAAGEFVVVGPGMYPPGVAETVPGIVGLSRDGVPCGGSLEVVIPPAPPFIPEPEPTPTPEPLTTPEPTPEPTPTPTPTPEAGTETPVGGVPTPTPEVVPTPTPTPEAVATPQPTPVSTPEPTPQPTPVVVTELPTPTPIPEPTPQPTPELAEGTPLLRIVTNAASANAITFAESSDWKGKLPAVGGYYEYAYLGSPTFKMGWRFVKSSSQQLNLNVGIGSSVTLRAWGTDEQSSVTMSSPHSKAVSFTSSNVTEQTTIYVVVSQTVTKSVSLPAALWNPNTAWYETYQQYYLSQPTRISTLAWAPYASVVDDEGFSRLTGVQFSSANWNTAFNPSSVGGSGQDYFGDTATWSAVDAQGESHSTRQVGLGTRKIDGYFAAGLPANNLGAGMTSSLAYLIDSTSPGASLSAQNGNPPTGADLVAGWEAWSVLNPTRTYWNGSQWVTDYPARLHPDTNLIRTYNGTATLTFEQVVHPGTNRSFPWKNFYRSSIYAPTPVGGIPMGDTPSEWTGFQWAPWVSNVTW